MNDKVSQSDISCGITGKRFPGTRLYQRNHTIKRKILAERDKKKFQIIQLVCLLASFVLMRVCLITGFFLSTGGSQARSVDADHTRKSHFWYREPVNNY